MHGSKQFVAEYVRQLEGAVRSLEEPLILFPPIGYLPLLAGLLAERELSGAVELGVQNVHSAPEGAFTGEVSAEMANDLGASWVLVGHSERREYAAESDEMVAAKAQAVLRAGLKPMLCVGETEAERDAGEAEAVVVGQLEAVIEACSVAALPELVIAYEPVWAIGTGKTATPAIAEEMHGLIRDTIERLAAQAPGGVSTGGAGGLAAQVPLLYGGSVNAGNAAALFAEPDIDGGLVGGASLKADELVAIARCLE